MEFSFFLFQQHCMKMKKLRKFSRLSGTIPRGMYGKEYVTRSL